MDNLLPYRGFEELEDLHQIFTFRCRIDDAMAYLRKCKADLDADLIRHMDAQGVSEYLTGPEGNRIEVRKRKKKKTAVNIKEMRRMLTNPENKEEAELALRCLSGGQSAWKAAEVQAVQDTIGRNDLIKTTYSDEVEIKDVNIDKLKALGRM